MSIRHTRWSSLYIHVYTRWLLYKFIIIYYNLRGLASLDIREENTDDMFLTRIGHGRRKRLLCTGIVSVPGRTRRSPRRRVRARARPPGGRLGRIIITHKNRSTTPWPTATRLLLLLLLYGINDVPLASLLPRSDAHIIITIIRVLYLCNNKRLYHWIRSQILYCIQ